MFGKYWLGKIWLSNIRLRSNIRLAKTWLGKAGNAHSFIKVRGSTTVQSTSCKTGLDKAVVDINKNFLYDPVRPAFWEVDGT